MALSQLIERTVFTIYGEHRELKIVGLINGIQ